MSDSTNPTHFMIFPVGMETEANTYLAACNAANPDNGGGDWYYPDVTDVYGQRVVAKLGAPWKYNGVVFEEPANLAGLRSMAVEHELWVAPPEEE